MNQMLLYNTATFINNLLILFLFLDVGVACLNKNKIIVLKNTIRITCTTTPSTKAVRLVC